jgi:hypothetical protein
MRRWLVTAAALSTGIATTALLLWYGSPERGAVLAYVLTRDVPAGSTVGLESVRLQPFRLARGVRLPLGPGSERRLQMEPAAHDLGAGQLIQAADLAVAQTPAQTPVQDRRLVLVPVKEAPPLAAGDHVDLLLITGSAERTSVVPFVLGLEVRAVSPAGLVVVASSRAASGLVYAGATSRLVAVAADRAARPGQEPAVSSMDDATAVARS